MRAQTIAHAQSEFGRLAARLVRHLPVLWTAAVDWHKGTGERSRNRKLNGHLSRDIGLLPNDLGREACESFWRS